MAFDTGLQKERPRVFQIQSALDSSKILTVAGNSALAVDDKTGKAANPDYQFRVYGNQARPDLAGGHIQLVGRESDGFLTRGANIGDSATLVARGASENPVIPRQQWYFSRVGKFTFILTPPDANDVVSAVTLVEDGLNTIVVKPLEDVPAPLHQLWLFVPLAGVE
jgi:hypothetical protein